MVGIVNGVVVRTGGRDGTTTHGMSRTSEYHIWAEMVARCTRPTHKRWADYGGRGISVCERWRTFVNFYADMGARPADLTLDRINNDGGYEPGNCRWATYKEQRHNQRRSCDGTTCLAGHAMTPENTRTWRHRRYCKACAARSVAEREEQQANKSWLSALIFAGEQHWTTSHLKAVYRHYSAGREVEDASADRLGTFAEALRGGKARLTDDEAREICSRYIRGRGRFRPGNSAEVATQLGVPVSRVLQVIYRYFPRELLV